MIYSHQGIYYYVTNGVVTINLDHIFYVSSESSSILFRQFFLPCREELGSQKICGSTVCGHSFQSLHLAFRDQTSCHKIAIFHVWWPADNSRVCPIIICSLSRKCPDSRWGKILNTPQTPSTPRLFSFFSILYCFFSRVNPIRCDLTNWFNLNPCHADVVWQDGRESKKSMYHSFYCSYVAYNNQSALLIVLVCVPFLCSAAGQLYRTGWLLAQRAAEQPGGSPGWCNV
jgi:hypothetical protein